MPPADIGAEMSLVGSMCMGPECIEDVLLVCGANDFTDGRHAVMFMALVELHRNVGVQIDAVQIHAHLRLKGKLEAAGGYDYLSEILGVVPGWAHWAHYAKIVRTLSIARQGITEAARLQAALYTDPMATHDTLNASQTALATLAVEGQTETGQLARDILPKVLAQLFGDDQKQREGDIWTHFPNIDKIMGPMHPGQMIAICGHAAHGKSTIAGAIAANNARLGVPGVIISLEMSKEDYVKRLLFNYAGVTQQQFKSQRLSPQQAGNVAEAHRIINEDAILIIDDKCAPNAGAIRAKLRLYQRQYGIKWVVIDNYQLMEGSPREERYQQLVQASREAKRMSTDIDIVIFLLCQLHERCLNEDRRPGLYDIADCKKPIKDADAVILMDWEGHRKRADAKWCAENPQSLDKVWFNIPKLRGAAGDTGFLRIQPSTYSFYDWQSEPAQSPLF